MHMHMEIEGLDTTIAHEGNRFCLMSIRTGTWRHCEVGERRGSLHAAYAESSGSEQGGCSIEAYARWIMHNHGMVLHPATHHHLWC